MKPRLKIIFVVFYLIFFTNANVFAIESQLIAVKTLFYQNDSPVITTPLQTARKFLCWYKENKEHLIKAPVMKKTKGASSFYRVDFIAAEKYIRQLKKSNLFSLIFLSALRNYLNLCDSNFKEHPQSDFIAKGFETNLVTQMMDDMDIMEDVNSVQLLYKQLPSHRAAVSVKGKFSPEPQMIFILTSYSGVWKIDSINGDFPKVLSFSPIK